VSREEGDGGGRGREGPLYRSPLSYARTNRTTPCTCTNTCLFFLTPAPRPLTPRSPDPKDRLQRRASSSKLSKSLRTIPTNPPLFAREKASKYRSSKRRTRVALSCVLQFLILRNSDFQKNPNTCRLVLCPCSWISETRHKSNGRTFLPKTHALSCRWH